MGRNKEGQEAWLGSCTACEPSTSFALKEASSSSEEQAVARSEHTTAFDGTHAKGVETELRSTTNNPEDGAALHSASVAKGAPARKMAVAIGVPMKYLLGATKSDAYLIGSTPRHYTRSLSKSDLQELKRSIGKSDFKYVQDPLSASKLKKNYSVDCHPCHGPVFEIGAPESPKFCSKSSRYACESVIDSEEGDVSRPSVLFPSVR